MKVLSHEDEVLTGEYRKEIAEIKREYYRTCIELLNQLKRERGLEFTSRIAVLSLFGMMNWIYTWYNPRADGRANLLARERSGNIFLRGLSSAANNNKDWEEFMATTMQPTSTEASKQLVDYRVENGVAVFELNDPPANTYTYEMNRQLDDCILEARMDDEVT